MNESVDFNFITPCGENCNGCEHLINKSCEGCIESQGKCIKMWSKGCEIFKCCNVNHVSFCGLCDEFPCQWLIEKIGEWNPEGIENLRKLREEYLK